MNTLVLIWWQCLEEIVRGCSLAAEGVATVGRLQESIDSLCFQCTLNILEIFLMGEEEAHVRHFY